MKKACVSDDSNFRRTMHLVPPYLGVSITCEEVIMFDRNSKLYNQEGATSASSLCLVAKLQVVAGEMWEGDSNGGCNCLPFHFNNLVGFPPTHIFVCSDRDVEGHHLESARRPR
ncbi:hypothetical protein NL676_035727 [Syzygium grande]|nr:hypothetical protein NL676_035727 [Syzygium grande]